jgi:hypothetical protein
VGAKVTVAAPALLFIAVEIAFSMNCPSGFWLEVEIEWLRLVCICILLRGDCDNRRVAFKNQGR